MVTSYNTFKVTVIPQLQSVTYNLCNFPSLHFIGLFTQGLRRSLTKLLWTAVTILPMLLAHQTLDFVSPLDVSIKLFKTDLVIYPSFLMVCYYPSVCCWNDENNDGGQGERLVVHFIRNIPSSVICLKNYTTSFIFSCGARLAVSSSGLN